jgi:hypothetical protein
MLSREVDPPIPAIRILSWNLLPDRGIFSTFGSMILIRAVSSMTFAMSMA